MQRPPLSSRISSRRSVAPQKRSPLSPDHIFGAFCVLLLALARWPLSWFTSGAPLLTYCLLAGEVSGNRILPDFHIWSLVASVNILYGVAATSWLLRGAYMALCYPVILTCCVYQYEHVAKFARRSLRKVLNEFQFTKDVIGLFDLPALEIDVDVQGLMCIRGVTLSLSTLTIVAHGVEVGIKFTDDMELALIVDTVTIKLFRRIDVGDVYGNVKGGEFEMTFGHLAPSTKTEEGDPLMVTDSDMLVAAAQSGDMSAVPTTPMADLMTDGNAPKNSSVSNGFKWTTTVATADDKAKDKYEQTLEWIEETSAISVARKEAIATAKGTPTASDFLSKEQDLRAAICSLLHDQPTIPHPSKRAIKVSTVKSLDWRGIRKFLHRFPLLLRVQLSLISYFHPVYISSITVGGSGAWIQNILSTTVFKDYAEDDSAIKNLRRRVSRWLSDANFVFQACKITGVGYVPLNTQYDITSTLNIDDIMAHRTMTKEIDLNQILRLGGADARIVIPSYLLPHHEHLLPETPTEEDERLQEDKVKLADGVPKMMQAEKALEQTRKDEANMFVSAHAKLPASLDQSLLNFVAALIKATKLIEIDKGDKDDDSDASETSSIRSAKGIKKLTQAIKTEVSSGIQRVAIDAAANDRWIAKLVGKITQKLESIQGDLGYSGEVPIPLAPYRTGGQVAAKILA